MKSRIGKFEIQAEIGRGGFGTVYRAFDPIMNRIVAIKVLVDTTGDEASFSRFKNEAVAAGNLHHPNIVTVYEFGQEGNTPYIVMEYLDGQDLQHIIKSGPELSLYRKLRIMEQVADGLHCGHRNGVFHRDVKPANIMVLTNGEGRIMDFGIARLTRDSATRLTQPGYLIGSVLYMAPELFSGSVEVDASCDIWSYGVVLYELLAGKNPFQTGHIQSEMYRIVNSDVPPLPAESCPEDLQAVVDRLLSRQRESRYQSMEDVRFDLQPVLQNLEKVETDRLLGEAQVYLLQQKWQEASDAALEIRRMDHDNATAKTIFERAQAGLQRESVQQRMDALVRRSDDAVAEGKIDEALELLQSADKLDQGDKSISNKMLELDRRKLRIEEAAKPAMPLPVELPDQPEPSEEPPRRLQPFHSFNPNPTPPIAPREYKPSLFTEMFRRLKPPDSPGPPPRVPEKPASASDLFREPTVADASKSQPTSPEPGEFTTQFLYQNPSTPPAIPRTAGSRPPPPPPPPKAGPERPPEDGDENIFTQNFRTRPEPTTPEPMSAACAPGEHTQIFTRTGASSQTPGMPAHSPFLVIAKSVDPVFVGRRADIRKLPFRIGRDLPDGQFDLSFDPAVSGSHVEIDLVKGGYVLRDLESRNGTFVSGRRVRPGRDEPLFFGTRIHLGSNTQIVFGSNEFNEIPDLTGLRIYNDRFLLEKKIHLGVKSAVYCALDTVMNRRVAIKILSPKLAEYPGYREQFQTEVATASSLTHPNICEVYDQGVTEIPGNPGKWLFVTMRHLEGGSLFQRFARNERLDLVAIAFVLEKICGALDYIHKKRIIHSGIKPTAIVFDSEGNPFLTDFAYATTPDSTSPQGVGAYDFFAPEQWGGETPTPATDQYSLGVLLYLMISGYLPFERQDDPDIRENNLRNEPIAVRDLARRSGREDIPPSVSPVVRRAISRQPADRYTSAGELAREFRKALDPVPSPPIKPTAPLIFISYRRSSSAPLALLIRNDLERQGWNVFVDSQQKDTIGRFPRKIEDNIRRSNVFLCILAGNTLESSWVKREIELAVSNERPMIPIFQEELREPEENLPTHVRTLLDCDGVPLKGFESYYMDAFLRWLSDCIRQILDSESKK